MLVPKNKDRGNEDSDYESDDGLGLGSDPLPTNIISAVLTVLEDAVEPLPLSIIVDEIELRNLYQFCGRTPRNTVSGEISKYLKHFEVDSAPIIKFGHGKATRFALRTKLKHPEQQMPRKLCLRRGLKRQLSIKSTHDYDPDEDIEDPDDDHGFGEEEQQQPVDDPKDEKSAEYSADDDDDDDASSVPSADRSNLPSPSPSRSSITPTYSLNESILDLSLPSPPPYPLYQAHPDSHLRHTSQYSKLPTPFAVSAPLTSAYPPNPIVKPTARRGSLLPTPPLPVTPKTQSAPPAEEMRRDSAISMNESEATAAACFIEHGNALMRINPLYGLLMAAESHSSPAKQSPASHPHPHPYHPPHQRTSSSDPLFPAHHPSQSASPPPSVPASAAWLEDREQLWDVDGYPPPLRNYPTLSNSASLPNLRFHPYQRPHGWGVVQMVRAVSLPRIHPTHDPFCYDE
ncbi:uncharacterized protein VTP21DRAFT_2135 [Calcarisporiella thermophila]|uniref:uncharacterized protein n=1 Tax=Calcarisporiella thermophila TaxID=911321 RepID=UPI0037444B5B